MRKKLQVEILFDKVHAYKKFSLKWCVILISAESLTKVSETWVTWSIFHLMWTAEVPWLGIHCRMNKSVWWSTCLWINNIYTSTWVSYHIRFVKKGCVIKLGSYLCHRYTGRPTCYLRAGCQLQSVATSERWTITGHHMVLVVQCRDFQYGKISSLIEIQKNTIHSNMTIFDRIAHCALQQWLHSPFFCNMAHHTVLHMGLTSSLSPLQQDWHYSRVHTHECHLSRDQCPLVITINIA